MSASLAGLRVMVPVTRERRALAQMVRDNGGTPVEVEFIAIAPSSDPAALEAATRAWCSGSYDWLAVTSRNAVLAMDAVARASGLRLADAVPPSLIAAVGDASRAVCASVGLPVALTPGIATARGLVADFPAGSGRVLAPLGDRAAPTLVRGLALAGWTVDSVEAYRTVAGEGPSPEQVEALAVGDVDAVFLTSGSMATLLASACPAVPPSVTLVAIGATTAAAARAAGLSIAAICEEPTYDALVRALERSTGRRTP